MRKTKNSMQTFLILLAALLCVSISNLSKEKHWDFGVSGALASNTKSIKPAILENCRNSVETTSTFFSLLSAAELDTLLVKGKKFTFFAPNNRALEKIDDLSRQKLKQKKNLQKLQALINHHIVEETIKLDFSRNKSWQHKNLNDVFLSLRKDGKTYVNDSEFAGSSIPCARGNIYVIDKIILPSMYFFDMLE